MNAARPFAGLRRHFWLSLLLNFRSKQALVYGYLVPVFFLLAFGSIFRTDTPPLVHEMGQLLTISILGGACFGLPTALVAERERGVWRRYRLLPVPMAGLIAGTLVARLLIIASAALLQLGLARLIYGTPFPLHPLQIVVAFVVVAFAFLGLGLLVAALADDVPAVQALGQCLFLPMVMIGGVGVPLAVLPEWAQRVAGFMPGRYAVDALQRCIEYPAGLPSALFSLGALLAIGAAAGAIGAKLFRWDHARRLERRDRLWVATALLAWVVVGATAAGTGHLRSVPPPDADYETLTDADIARITYDDLPGDNELVTRLAPPFKDAAASAPVADVLPRLRTWPAADLRNHAQSVRNLLSLVAIADAAADPREAELARAVYDELLRRFERDELKRLLAWIVFNPDEGTVVRQAPEFKLRRHPPERLVRQRCELYARKYLGRLVGQLHD